MASDEIDIAVGYLLSGATMGATWSPQIVDITPMATEVDDIQTSHQGTTSAHTYIPADIKENTEVTVEHFFKPDEKPTVGGTPEVWTLTYPDAIVSTFTGYVKSYTPGTGTLNERMMCTTVIKVSGDISGTGGQP